MDRLQQKIIIALATLAMPLPAYADVELDKWIEVDAASETTTPAAEALGQPLGKHLKAEGSKIIFLNIAQCDPGLTDTNNWCPNFQNSLETYLIHQGFRFLPEATKDDIRQKIAQEQVYQQNSMQVDTSKAVALGQQKAFNAFVTIAVSGDGKGNIRLSANSVNIKDGTVSISENANLKLQQETVRPWGVVFKGWMLMGGGLAVTGAGLYQANKSQQKSNDDYASYNKATTPDAATSARDKVSQDDKLVSLYQDVAIVGGVVGLYGLYYYMTNKEQSLSYKITTASTQQHAPDRDWHVEPMLSRNMLGLVVRTSW